MEHTSKRRGTVKGVSENYSDPDMADVEMEEPPTAEQRTEHKKNKFSGEPHGKRHSMTMPHEHAGHFKVGDPVELEQTLRHFGHRGANKDPRHQVAGGERKKAEEAQA